MRIVITLLICYAVHDTIAQDYGVIKNQAKQNDLPILLVFSGSDWCANCIRLKKVVFDDPNYSNVEKDHFLKYTADFPRVKKESPEYYKQNEKLAERFNPKGNFPFLVLLSHEEKVIRSYKGKFNNLAEFEAWLKIEK
ncbi:MAG: thioredoxin family protein [Schleiferiaceae bacterium]|jgi:thioredoxin-related protein|nr:thioredoxin family protein [Schleiferiaceae bacterium]